MGDRTRPSGSRGVRASPADSGRRMGGGSICGEATYGHRPIANDPRRTHMSRVIAVSSQKGGIGKTTMAGNLAVAWSERGRHVLLVDLDPQFALTRRFGISPADA